MTDEDDGDATDALREAIEQLRDRTEDLAETAEIEFERGERRPRPPSTANPADPSGGTRSGDPFRDHCRRPLPKQREDARSAAAGATGTGEAVQDLRAAMERYHQLADEPDAPEAGEPATPGHDPPTVDAERAGIGRPAAKLAAAFAVVLVLSPMGSIVLPTQTFAVTTSAMAPTVPEGSLAILVEGVDVAEGDVVVYASPQGGERIRRVTEVIRGDDGTSYRVEADGQQGGPSIVVDRADLVGRVATHLPHLGVIWTLPAPGTMLVFGGVFGVYAAWVVRKVLVDDGEGKDPGKDRTADREPDVS